MKHQCRIRHKKKFRQPSLEVCTVWAHEEIIPRKRQCVLWQVQIQHPGAQSCREGALGVDEGLGACLEREVCDSRQSQASGLGLAWTLQPQEGPLKGSPALRKLRVLGSVDSVSHLLAWPCSRCPRLLWLCILLRRRAGSHNGQELLTPSQGLNKHHSDFLPPWFGDDFQPPHFPLTQMTIWKCDLSWLCLVHAAGPAWTLLATPLPAALCWGC